MQKNGIILANVEENAYFCNRKVKLPEFVASNMCRYTMSFNDAVMNEMRPHFRDEESLLVWLEVSMDHLMCEYIARFKKTNIDGDQLLRKLNALPDTPAGFLQLNGILGKQGAGFSWDDLREDAYSDKYGI